MTTAQRGKPYCKKAGRRLKEPEMDQCEACAYIVYVGCPGFDIKTGYSARVKEYLKWWYDEKDILVASREITPESRSSEQKGE